MPGALIGGDDPDRQGRRRRRSRARWPGPLLAVGLALTGAACAGGGSPASGPSSSATRATPATSAAEPAAAPRVLVFHRAVGFVHDTIPLGVEVLREVGGELGFEVDATDDPARFEASRLAPYAAVVFLHTTGDVLPSVDQRAALEGYVDGGGGWLGIHAASDMGEEVATSWPWYRALVGAAFAGHTPARTWSDAPGGAHEGPLSAAPPDATPFGPGVVVATWQPATVTLDDPASPAAGTWPSSTTIVDEWYGFDDHPGPGVRVIASVDESSFDPGEGAMGADHPVVWCQVIGDGRSVYTALGHPPSLWSDPGFRAHLRGALEMAVGTRWRC